MLAATIFTVIGNCHQSNCSQVAWEDKGKYRTIAFAEEAVNVIQAHPTASPLFMCKPFIRNRSFSCCLHICSDRV